MTLATKDNPNPDPLDFVETNGSNKCNLIFSGMPGPSSSIFMTIGNLSFLLLPETLMLNPCL